MCPWAYFLICQVKMMIEWISELNKSLHVRILNKIMHIRAWHSLTECSAKLAKMTIYIRWKKYTFLKNWCWTFVLVRVALAVITNKPLPLISQSQRVQSGLPWLSSASPHDKSWIQTPPILPCPISRVTRERKRLWRRTRGIFQEPSLEVRHTTSDLDPSTTTWSCGHT